MAVSGILGKSPERMQAVTLRGNVTNIGKERLDEIFEKNPYLQEIYPNKKSRRDSKSCCMEKGEGEYITLHGFDSKVRTSFIWRCADYPERILD